MSTTKHIDHYYASLGPQPTAKASKTSKSYGTFNGSKTNVKKQKIIHAAVIASARDSKSAIHTLPQAGEYSVAPQMGLMDLVGPLTLSADSDLIKLGTKLTEALSTLKMTSELNIGITETLEKMLSVTGENLSRAFTVHLPLIIFFSSSIHALATHDTTSMSVASALGLYLAAKYGGLVAGHLKTCLNYVKNMISDHTKPQMEMEHITTIVQQIVLVIGGLSAFSIPDITKLPSSIYKHLNTFDRASVAMNDIVMSVVSTIEGIVNHIRTNLFGCEALRFLDSKHKAFDDFIDSLHSLYHKLDNHLFSINSENHLILQGLLADALVLRKKLASDRSTTSLLRIIDTEVRRLEKTNELFSSSNYHLKGARIEPVGILLMGAPGVGKSCALEHVREAVSARIFDDESYERYCKDPEHAVFNRCTETGFWSSYTCERTFTVFDDILQQVDVAGQTNEAIEVIRCINTAEYDLYMDAIEQKGVTKFRSRFVLATSNVTNFRLNSINETEAFTRRWDFPYIMYPRDEFCMKETLNGSLKCRRLDPSKIPKRMSSDGIEYTSMSPQEFSMFQRVDLTPGSGEPKLIGKPITFKELIDLINLRYLEKLLWDKNRKIDLQSTRDEQRTRFFVEEEPTVPQGLFSNMASELKLEPFDDDEVSGVVAVSLSPENMSMISLFEETCEKFEVSVKKPIGSVYKRIRTAMAFTLGLIHQDDIWRDVAFIRFHRRCGSAIYAFIEKYLETPTATMQDLVSELFWIYHSFTDDDSDNLFVRSVRKVEHIVDTIKDQVGVLRKKISDIVAQFNASDLYSLVKTAAPYLLLLATLGSALHLTGMNGWLIDWYFKPLSVVPKGLISKPHSARPMKQRQRAARSFKDIRALGGVPQGGAAVDPNGMMIVDKIRRKNHFGFSLEHPTPGNKRIICGYALAIVDTIVVMPRHFVDLIVNKHEELPSLDVLGKNVYFTKFDVRGEPIDVHSMTGRELFACVLDVETENLDQVYLQLPKDFRNCRDIRKYFPTNRDVSMNKSCNARLVPPEGSKRDSYNMIAKWNPEPVPVGLDPLDPEYTLKNGYSYNSYTDKGDCGMILTMVNPSMTAKIWGIHSAGGNGWGHSTTITKEVLDRVFKSTLREPITREFDMIAQPQADMWDVNPNIEVAEKIPKPIFVGGESSIKASRLIGAWGPPKNKPCHLKKFQNHEGMTVDPWHYALSKYCRPFVQIHHKYISAIGDSLLNHLREVSAEDVEHRLLSYQEAIAGIENESDFGAISRTTSPGYPLVFDKHGQLNFKQKVFGIEGDYTFTAPEWFAYKLQLEEIEAKAKNSVRTPMYFIDCLKDETKPIEKVEIGKTRLFSACPLDLLILVRRYFGSYILWFQKNRIDNGSAIGVNPYSMEWHKLALKLRSMGGQFRAYGAGDYSGFDGTEKPIVHWAILDVINKWYDDGFDQVRSVLWCELVNSQHIIGGTSYEWTSSLPSGFALTTLVNIMYNHFAFRYAWLKLHDFDPACLSEFALHVAVCFMGDDNIFAVSPDYRFYFTEAYLSEVLADLGLVYTSDMKSEAHVALRDFSEISFEKRTFVYSTSEGRYIAPLTMDTILESPYWTRIKCKGMTETDLVKANVQNSLSELSLHSLEVYNRWAPKMCKALKNHYHEWPSCDSYSENRAKCLSREDYY